jgi:hypothetical protein
VSRRRRVGELAREQALSAAGLGEERGGAVELDGVAAPLQGFGEAAVTTPRGPGRVAS